ncbi:SRPBCC family protein [Streptomyces sp. NBS 14/10]|uniref:SRPBCC family protein n=1 Tax=Streptomyces sp. NBS 14/10 TaxID=1945643 RepID=UPI000B7DBE16|nr:SRPBCC family protein [Streptomyces sp. NBS 14/10]KAK1182758.1 SRPBCC family protein [Streptomyces sp. NBS 14/10]
MTLIRASVDIDVPVQIAYNQWTQFPLFPRFMDGVKRVDRPQSSMTHWVTKMYGVIREFDAETVEQRPDERLRWRSLEHPERSGRWRSRPRHVGRVEFQSLEGDRSRVTLAMSFKPSGVMERAGGGLGIVRRHIQGELENFKEFIEEEGSETGRWRGAIKDGYVQPESGQERPQVPNWPCG